MVSFQVVFRELAIVRKSLLINKDGIFGRDRTKALFQQFSETSKKKRTKNKYHQG
jgi:hypothetical protein